MRQSLQRALYRVAHPLLAVTVAITRVKRRGAKCLLTCEGEVLLVRHTYGDRRRWDLPGGIVGFGESAIAAARRELREELGVEAAQLDDLGPRVLRLRGRPDHDIHYFHARAASREVTPDPVELAEARWFAPAALPERLGQHVREVVERVLGDGA